MDTFFRLTEERIPLPRKLLRFLLPAIGLSVDDLQNTELTLPSSWGWGSILPAIDRTDPMGDDLIFPNVDNTYGVIKGIVDPRPGILGEIDYVSYHVLEYRDISPHQDTFEFIQQTIDSLGLHASDILEHAARTKMAYPTYKQIENRIAKLTKKFSDYVYVDTVILPILRKKMGPPPVKDLLLE